jgi:hypothetical protein
MTRLFVYLFIYFLQLCLTRHDYTFYAKFVKTRMFQKWNSNLTNEVVESVEK